jgi:hypothetical protein
MRKQLIAKPAVRRTTRIIQVPKTVKSKALRPNPNLNKIIKSVKSKKAAPKVQKIKKKTTTIVKKQLQNKIVKPVKNQHTIQRRNRVQTLRRQSIRRINKKSPRVSYHNNHLTPKDIKRLNKIKNSGAGRILIMVGNGPSIVEAELNRLINNNYIDIMSINKPDQRVWPSKYWLFCDNTQYNRNKEAWSKYTGIIFNTASIRNKKENTYRIRNVSGSGFSLNLTEGFHIGRSSVYAAMQVANWLNYDQVYIFGCDMCEVNIGGHKMMHFYGVNPDVNPKNRGKRFDREAKYYTEAAGILSSKIRKKFTFCSAYLKYDFANKFNKMDHRSAIDHILEQAEELEKPNETAHSE